MGKLADVFDISVQVLKVSEEVTESLVRFRDQTAAYNFLIQTLERFKTDIMAKLNDQAAQFGARLDALEAQGNKVLAEIRKALAGVSPDDLKAAIDKAKADVKAADEADFDAAVDAAFAQLTAKADNVQTAFQKIDDLVPDAPANGGTDTGNTGGTPTNPPVDNGGPIVNPTPTPEPAPTPVPEPNPTPVVNPTPTPTPDVNPAPTTPVTPPDVQAPGTVVDTNPTPAPVTPDNGTPTV